VFQENLWATAPMPIGLTTSVVFVPLNDHWSLRFSLSWSKDNDAKPGDFFAVTLENDETDVIPYLINTAFRVWTVGQRGMNTERAVKAHLRQYREASNPPLVAVSGFHSVDFG
jgi:hypothetical protein